METLGIDEIARRLFAGLPPAAQAMRRDIESNFRAVLQSSLSKLELTTREQFDVQTKVLQRTRARLGELEARVAMLERRLGEEPSAPPLSDPPLAD